MKQPAHIRKTFKITIIIIIILTNEHRGRYSSTEILDSMSISEHKERTAPKLDQQYERKDLPVDE